MPPVRTLQFQIAAVMADLMPDVAMALGIEVDDDVPLSILVGTYNETIEYDRTQLLKQERRCCPIELETEFRTPACGEFVLFRRNNRPLGNSVGRRAQPSIYRRTTFLLFFHSMKLPLMQHW